MRLVAGRIPKSVRETAVVLYRQWRLAAAFACVLLGSSPRLPAQVLSGIAGTITDARGNVIVGANVTATNTATEVASHTVTTPAGTYVITDLIPGAYWVKFEMPGFKTQIVTGIVIDSGGRKVTVDGTLRIGRMEEVVQVSAPLISIETAEPELGTTIEHALIEELPIEMGASVSSFSTRGRRIDSFIFITPGVTGGVFSHRINGGVDFANEIIFNGLPLVQDQTPGFQEIVNPPYEMVDEARVITSVFSPQYGLGQGVASFQFASGTNDLHGSAFEVLRDSSLDAPGAYPILDTNGHKITPADHEHNFGFSLGGPVLLPKIYSGRNKTFFHADVEWYRLNVGTTQLGTVPTDAMRNGDFSNYFFFNTLPDGQVVPQQIPIYVPQAWANPSLVPPGCSPGAHGYVPGQQFPGNQIDPSCFSPISQKLLTLIPHANNPRTSNPNQNNKFTEVSSFPTREVEPGFSIDHNLTETQKLHGSYWRAPYTAYFPGFAFSADNPLTQLESLTTYGMGIVLNYSNAIKSNLVMTVGAFFLENQNDYNPTAASTQRNAFPSIVASGVYTPQFDFNANTSAPNAVSFFGPGIQIGRSQLHGKGLSVANNWIYTRGRHTWNFGAEFRYSGQHGLGNCDCAGTINFSNNTTSNNDPNTGDASNINDTGSAFASFLLGDVDTAFRSNPAFDKLRNFAVSPYVVDDIKLTPHLTLDAGLRWDVLIPFTSVGSGSGGQVTFFDPKAPNPGVISTITGQALDGALGLLGTCADCAGYDRANIHWSNLGPRAGLAYQLNRRTVILSGFALSFLIGGAYDYGDTKIGEDYTGLLAGALPPSYTTSGYPGPGIGQWDTGSSFPLPAPRATAFQPTLCNGLLSPLSCVNFFSRDPGAYPYSESWNAGIQRELRWNLILSVAYVGNRGVHLPSGLRPLNQLNPELLNLCANDGGASNCVLGDSWTCTTQTLDGSGNPTFPCPAPVPAQTVLGQLGYGKDARGFNSVYQSFSNDFGESVPLLNALVPYPQYATVRNNFETQGSSSYNALQTQVQKRFSEGIGFLVNYTLSRSMANAESGFGAFAAPALNKYDLAAEYTVASYDQTHFVNLSGVYELPIGPGKRVLGGGGGVKKNVAGGWQVSGILQYQSGMPFGVGASGNPLNNGFNRANIVPGIKPVISWKNIDKADSSGNPLPVLNPRAFSDPGPWVPGNAPRELGSLRLPPSYNENVALAKTFFGGDHLRAEVRIEFFNVLNRVMKSCMPDTNISDGGFGLAPQQCQSNLPRQGQAYFRMSF